MKECYKNKKKQKTLKKERNMDAKWIDQQEEENLLQEDELNNIKNAISKINIRKYNKLPLFLFCKSFSYSFL